MFSSICLCFSSLPVWLVIAKTDLMKYFYLFEFSTRMSWYISSTEFEKILDYVKPKFFVIIFTCPGKVIKQVQNGNWVLNQLVLCLKCMKLACWVLQASLDLYYYLRLVKMMTKNFASWNNLSLSLSLDFLNS